MQTSTTRQATRRHGHDGRVTVGADFADARRFVRTHRRTLGWVLPLIGVYLLLTFLGYQHLSPYVPALAIGFAEFVLAVVMVITALRRKFGKLDPDVMRKRGVAPPQ